MSAPARILVVDDDPTVSEVVARYLRRAGLEVTVVSDGLRAVEVALATAPDLVVLDLMLPGLDGLTVFGRIRERSPVPIVMLTALSDEADRLVGLELGADDYVTKPFSPRELVLRVQSILRRSTAEPVSAAPASVLTDGDLVVDLGAHEVTLSGQTLALTAREYDLLAFLMQNPRQAFDRAQLLARVWGWDFGDQSTVTVHVRRLREKVEPDATLPTRIVTVFGVGYRYEPEPA